MLDLTGIMFSSIMMLLVVLKAAQLDRVLPWFEIPRSLSKNPPVAGKTAPAPGQTLPSWRARARKTPTDRS